MTIFIANIVKTQKNIHLSTNSTFGGKVKKLIAIYISIKINIHVGNLFIILLKNCTHFLSESFSESNFLSNRFIKKYRTKNIKIDKIIIHIVFQYTTLFVILVIKSSIV
jgi:hypothetical protein